MAYDYYNSRSVRDIPTASYAAPAQGRIPVSEPFAIDFEVLPHLNGYPEELHRYANLMKQTHPRGMSAVEFLLGRAGAQDGFLEAICRLVKGGESLVTAVEAAELAGVPPRTFLEDLAARSDFPAPVFRREHRAIWRKRDVEKYLQAHG